MLHGFLVRKECFKAISPILSFGKFKGSYGITGNDQIGDYRYLNIYDVVNVQVPYQNLVALGPTALANPYIQWETTKKVPTRNGFRSFQR